MREINARVGLENQQRQHERERRRKKKADEREFLWELEAVHQPDSRIELLDQKRAV